MNQQITRLLYLSLSIVIFSTACKKQELPPLPVLNNQFQFTIDALPGESSVGIHAIYALVTIQNANGQDVVSNKKLALTYSGKYVTEKLELPAGNYKLKKFLVNNEEDITRFATPIAGSGKASLVSKPLMIEMKLPNSSILNIPLQVLKVEATDSPDQYGYPAGSFNQHPGEEEQFIRLKLKAVISVGDVLYDSIPAQFRITTWKNAGEFTNKDTTLAAGTNEVLISKSAVKYSVRMMKWGIVDDLEIMKDEVNESTVYILGGNKAAKKLTSATEYKFVNGVFELDKKQVFEYDNQNKLKEIKYFTTSPTGLKYTYSEVFKYDENQLKIFYADPYNGSAEDYHYKKFVFDAQGRAIQSEYKYLFEHHKYQKVYSSTGIKMYLLDAHDQPTDVQLHLKIIAGNRVEQKYISATSTYTSGYTFDANINPYVHLKWPELYFSHNSKNNIVDKGSISQNGELYVMSKKQNFYDNDGFVSEVIKTSRITGTNQFKTVSKIVYAY
jgi:hypothetical protein